MKSRPLSVTFVAWVFIAAGAFGFVHHALDLSVQAPDYELLWVLVVRILAIVGGVFLLRGANWARWLVLLWMVYHVFLSTMHSVSEMLIHIVFLAGITYVLLHPKVSHYFQNKKKST